MNNQDTARPAPTAYWCVYYKDKFVLSDNLDKRDALLPPREAIYNPSLNMALIVLQGSMHIVVNGVSVILRSNDCMVIQPFSTIEFLLSRCVFIFDAVRSPLLLDMVHSLGIQVNFAGNSFRFSVYHFSSEVVARLKAVYLITKREMLRPEHYMKEHALRSFFLIFYANIVEHLPLCEEILQQPLTRQRKLFEKFLTDLDTYYNEERSVQFYAQRCKITAKYLSTLSLGFMGCTASVIIERYVVFRIKMMFYKGDMNVKQVSEFMNFASQSFMGRYFKRVSGMSPREYISMNCKRYVERDAESDILQGLIDATYQLTPDDRIVVLSGDRAVKPY